MARIIVGVTGGIAAYRACELVRLLVRAGHDVTPIVTAAAERFVTSETFLALARKPRSVDPYEHLQRADLLVVAPLTANTMARLAHGLADDILTETALAHDGPVVVAPAMNTRMWEHPATRANLALLVSREVEIVGPVAGELAEGEVGMGRMAEPATIADRIAELLVPTTSLTGRSVVVSAGGTREPLDAVRFLGNRSSGRMGVAVAAEAARRGADVTLLAANVTVPVPDGITVVATPTAADVAREALARVDADVIVMAAAVADYRPAATTTGKRPKDDTPWSVDLEPTLDVARELGSRKNGSLLVTFGAEIGATGAERKREMLTTKNADLVVFNDVGRADIGFDTDDNEVTLMSRDGDRHVAKASKAQIAVEIVDAVERLLESRT